MARVCVTASWQNTKMTFWVEVDNKGLLMETLQRGTPFPHAFTMRDTCWAVPAWPAVSASPRPHRHGPAGHARAEPSELARSPPGAAWHPPWRSTHPPVLSPVSAGHWRPVQPPGGLAPARAPGGTGSESESWAGIKMVSQSRRGDCDGSREEAAVSHSLAHTAHCLPGIILNYRKIFYGNLHATFGFNCCNTL